MYSNDNYNVFFLDLKKKLFFCKKFIHLYKFYFKRFKNIDYLYAKNIHHNDLH